MILNVFSVANFIDKVEVYCAVCNYLSIPTTVQPLKFGNE